MLGARELLRLNLRLSDWSTFEILWKLRNFENSTEGCTQSLGKILDRVIVMENLRKSFPGPHQVENYKITVHTLKNHFLSNFENFQLRAQKTQQKIFVSKFESSCCHACLDQGNYSD